MTIAAYDSSTRTWPNQTLAPFAGVSIKSVPPPVVTAISGCPVVGSDGLSVAQCLPDANVLTLTGSGFLQWQKTTLYINIGNLRIPLSLYYDNSSLYNNVIMSDSVIVLSLTSSYSRLLKEGDFGAPPLSFYITEMYSSWQSVPMSIQFAALPPPSSITVAMSSTPSNSVPTCMWGPNRSSLVNCTAGYDVVEVRGHYLFQTTLTVNGLAMSLQPGYTATFVRFATPLYSFQPGVLYDLVLTGAGGSVTLPKYMSFAGQPAIVSASCRDPLLPSSASSPACQPGETVLLNGPNLPPPSTAFTVTIYSAYSKQNVTCADPRYNSEYQLACDMLEAGRPGDDWDTW